MALDRQFFLRRSYEKAFGQFDEVNWDPALGFAANQPRILKLYDYYRDTYLARPDLFLWAGLGRMAGGAVVGGLRLAVLLGENFFTQTMVRIGKEIFHDMAWQHEAVLDDPDNALKLVAARDGIKPSRRSYFEAWTHVLSADPLRVATGNRLLLENEQFSIIQPLYDAVVANNNGLLSPMRSLKGFTNSIHPYHRDFLLSLPSGDIVNPADRWSWITETGGMYEKWAEKRGVPALPVAMSPQVRERLVKLSIDDLIRRNFGVPDPALLPPGAFDI